MNEKTLSNILLEGVSVIVIFVLAYFSPITNSDSDPLYTLLVTQAFLEYQTIQLDAYPTVAEKEVDHRLYRQDNHTYYAYPLGTSVLALPVVLPFYLAGYDMSNPAHENGVQNGLSAILVVLIAILFYRITSFYLLPPLGLFITNMAILGTTLMSTIGTALWSMDVATLFVCLSLWILVRLENKKPVQYTPYLLGICLFFAFFSRPTTAVFIAAVFIFLLFRHRSFVWLTALTSIFLLLSFIAFSQKTYGLWLPPYYLPRSLGGLMSYSSEEATPFLIAVYALLFSPSRGLFIYSPIFLLAFSSLIYYWRLINHRALLWFVIITSLSHIFFVARFPNWWGGYSFGPRLLTDITPVFMLLTILVTQAWTRDKSYTRRLGIAFLFLLAASMGIFIHSYIGMFGRYTLLSHGHTLPPHVDKAPYMLLDWRYPQFLTTPVSVCAKNKTYLETMLTKGIISLQDYSFHEEILPQEAAYLRNLPHWAWWEDINLTEEISLPFPQLRITNQQFLPIVSDTPSDTVKIKALFVGWMPPAEHNIWSACHTAIIVISPVASATIGTQATLTVVASGHQTQPVTVQINGQVVDTITFSPETTTETVTFPTILLSSNTPNYITFDIPEAFTPEGMAEPLLLGINLEKLVID